MEKSYSLLYSSFILDLCIVYELNNGPHASTNNFPGEFFISGRVKLVRKAIKSKFMYHGSGIAFDGSDLWNLDNNFGRNVVIFGAGNSSSSHTDNRKNNVIVLGQGPTDSINP